MTRTPLIAANWRMYKTVGEAESAVRALEPKVGADGDVDVVICPSFLALAPLWP